MESKILEKGKIGLLEIKNRTVIPAMGAVFGDYSGYLCEREIAYYEARAKGGYGLIVSALCMIGSAELGGSCGALDLTKPDASEHFKELMKRIHKYGSKMIFQIGSLGRQGMSSYYQGHQPVAPSELKEAVWSEMPRALSTAEVKQLVDGFVKGAKVLFDGDVDGVELHGAHGYLIHQFMSPRANKRTDEYGGSFENRMRFVTEIVEGINKVKPADRIISIRLNARDGLEDGLTIDDCIKIAQYLEKIGVDCVDLSQGTHSVSHITNEPSHYPEGCRTEQVKRFKDALKIPVIAVNNIKRPETAEKLLKDGVCDFVGLGRPSLCEPDYVVKIENGEPETIRSCMGCNTCHEFRASATGYDPYDTFCQCACNPYLGKEYMCNDETLIKSGEGKNAVVIGGGPGSMNAAEILARKGFHVILLDKNSALGGSLALATKATGKEKVQWAIDGYAARLKKANVEVKLNSKVSNADDVKKYNPSVVVVAVGGLPIQPRMPGIDLPNVKQAHDVLRDNADIKNKNIIIIGSGMTGLETADVLLGKGNKIRMYDMLDEIAKGAEGQTRYVDMTYLAENGVSFHPNHKAVEITETGVVFENMETHETVMEIADLVILSLGVKADKSLESFAQAFDKVIFLGDCAEPGKVVDATRRGLKELWPL